VTGACAEIVYISGGPLEPDYDAPVTYDAFAAVLDEQTEPVADGTYVDIDPRGDDPFKF